MKQSRRSKYHKITHAERIRAIYLKNVHGLLISDIEQETGIKYNSIRNILRTYRNSGMTNKKLIVLPRSEVVNAEGELSYKTKKGKLVNVDLQWLQNQLGIKDSLRSVLEATVEGDESPGTSSKHEFRSSSTATQTQKLSPPQNASSSGWSRIKLTQVKESQECELCLEPCTEEDFADYGQTDNVELITTDQANFQNSRNSRLNIFTGKLSHLNEFRNIREGSKEYFCLPKPPSMED